MRSGFNSNNSKNYNNGFHFNNTTGNNAALNSQAHNEQSLNPSLRLKGKLKTNKTDNTNDYVTITGRQLHTEPEKDKIYNESDEE